MRQSLNTAPSIREYTKLIYQFKRYLTRHNIFLSLYDQDIKDYGLWFKIWLDAYKHIKDLDKHMENIEKNYNPLDLYFKRSTGYYKIVNR